MEFEREERERLDLQRMIRGEITKGSSTVSAGAKEAVKDQEGHLAREGPQDQFTVPNPQMQSAESTSLLTTPKEGAEHQQRRLKIYRTIKNSDGTESVRTISDIHMQGGQR